MGKHAIHFLSNKYQISSEENAFFISYREKIAKYGHDYELSDFDLPQSLDDTMFKHRETIDRNFL